MASSFDLYKKVLEETPMSVYVADREGTTLYVNRLFQSFAGIKSSEVVGRNVNELEAEGYFRPSVLRLVMHEKRPLTIVQSLRNGEIAVVNGIPLFDEDGEIELLLSSAVPLDNIKSVIAYLQERPNAYRDASLRNVEIVTASKAMKNVMEMVNQVKDTDPTIMLSGESGVGKGVLARYIHENSLRAGKKLIEINCGAIPENLVESELFGYESGAFTGANARGKPGLIELAHGGTLFLDEISDISLSVQVKLLKVLQDKRLIRIGGKEYVDVDIRIIAATNKKLEFLVVEGLFRADLYYRLNVIPIEIPPLRKRREDISAMFDYFLANFIDKYHKSIQFTESFKEALMQYDWPGNVRELENYLERKLLTNKSGILDHADANDICEDDKIMMMIDEIASSGNELDEAVAQLESKLVNNAYRNMHSSYGVAKALGISQTSAYRKIRKYVSNPPV